MNDQNYTPEVVDVVDAAPKLPMQENGKPLKRKQYLFSAASMKTRITSFIALGLAALFILLVVIGTISTLNADIWDIPLFGMVMDKKELKSLENQVEDAYDEIKDVIRSKDDEEIEGYEGLEDLYERVVATAKDESECCEPDDCEDIDYDDASYTIAIPDEIYTEVQEED